SKDQNWVTGTDTVMLIPSSWRTAHATLDRPVLMVIVDTEEEFDWSRPVARENTATTSIAAQTRAHRLFERHGIKPAYVIDYPVATQPDGWGPLAELHADGLCEIGAHLHPWVNPPFD